MSTSHSVGFREAATADINSLLLLVAEYYAFDQIPFDERDVHRGLQALLEDPALGRAWLMEQEGNPAGYAVLTFGYDHEFGGRIGTLTDFYLKPEFRGRGIGTEALLFVEAQAKRLGLGAIELQTTRHNILAQKLYGKLGYTALDRILMIKRL